MSSSLVAGAISGFVATAAMTAAMRRFHRRLPLQERYPLPPRELTERVLPTVKNETAANATLLAHFGYGAGTGAVFSVLAPMGGALSGGIYGLAIWALSYLGWIPSARLLRPASTHPLRRNLLMLASHVIWGAATAIMVRELEASRATIFSGGPAKDAKALQVEQPHTER